MMVMSWLWMLFLMVFLIASVTYGWGYRRWGPPYPRFVQRRRSARASASGSEASSDHHAWGWGGDVLWIVFLIWIWIIWALAAGWRR